LALSQERLELRAKTLERALDGGDGFVHRAVPAAFHAQDLEAQRDRVQRIAELVRCRAVETRGAQELDRERSSSLDPPRRLRIAEEDDARPGGLRSEELPAQV